MVDCWANFRILLILEVVFVEYSKNFWPEFERQMNGMLYDNLWWNMHLYVFSVVIIFQ